MIIGNFKGSLGEQATSLNKILEYTSIGGVKLSVLAV